MRLGRRGHDDGRAGARPGRPPRRLGRLRPVADDRRTAPPNPRIDDDQLVRLMYTSGTESRPKAAMHTSRSLMWQYVSTIVAGEMSHDDVEIHSLPLYHCAQLDNFLATDIYLGATSIILPRPDPEAGAAHHRALRRHQLLRATDGMDLAAALARSSTRWTCPACARATTARRRCRSRSWTKSATGCPI